jgi:hypothetical protein
MNLLSLSAVQRWIRRMMLRDALKVIRTREKMRSQKTKPGRTEHVVQRLIGAH